MPPRGLFGSGAGHVRARALPVLLIALSSLRCGGDPSLPEPQLVTPAAQSLIIPMDTDRSATRHARLQPEQRHVEGVRPRLHAAPERHPGPAGRSSHSGQELQRRRLHRDDRQGQAHGHRARPVGLPRRAVHHRQRRRRQPPADHHRLVGGATATSPTCTRRGAGFSANVDIVLRSAPRIANEAINAGITIAYYNAAGIPDLNGNPWSTSSPNILDETEIANGGLFTAGYAACSASSTSSSPRTTAATPTR